MSDYELRNPRVAIGSVFTYQFYLWHSASWNWYEWMHFEYTVSFLHTKLWPCRLPCKSLEYI